MDAILTDSSFVLLNVIAPKLAYAGEVWEGNERFIKQLGNSTDGSS